MDITTYIWLAITVIAVIAEACTQELIAIWFIPASLVCIGLSLFDVDVGTQIIVFVFLSLIGVILSFIYLRKHKRDNKVKTNIDAIVGEKCIVTEKIDNYAGCGQAKVNGQYWSARSVSDEDTFDVGDVLHVVAIEGVKLICKK